MDLACRRLRAAGRPDGLIACTDADTRADPRWLATQIALVRAGAEAIGGRIDLDPAEPPGCPPPRSIAAASARTRGWPRCSPSDAEADHHFFSGASMAVTAAPTGGGRPRAATPRLRTRRSPGAWPRRPAHRALRPRARRTSARVRGRAPRGLARDLQLGDWLARRRHDGDDYDLDRLLAAKGRRRCRSCSPPRLRRHRRRRALARGHAVRRRRPRRRGAGGRRALDRRHGAARPAAGARVAAQDDLLPEYGPALGKGDAMWRALSATRGDVVAFLDADTADPAAAHLLGLLGPLLEDPSSTWSRARSPARSATARP